MKKIFVSTLLVPIFMLITTLAFATCYEGACDPAPDPCGTPECAGGFGGNITVKMMGASQAWGGDSEAYSVGQYNINQHIDKGGVTGDVQLGGGYFGESSGPNYSEAGGLSIGKMEWAVKNWEIKLND